MLIKSLRQTWTQQAQASEASAQFLQALVGHSGFFDSRWIMAPEGKARLSASEALRISFTKGIV